MEEPEYWKIIETFVADRVLGRKTAGSGCGLREKGDVITEGFLIECKSTIKDHIQLKKEWIIKINAEAYSVDKIPALVVAFVDNQLLWIFPKDDPVKTSRLFIGETIKCNYDELYNETLYIPELKMYWQVLTSEEGIEKINSFNETVILASESDKKVSSLSNKKSNWKSRGFSKR